MNSTHLSTSATRSIGQFDGLLSESRISGFIPGQGLYKIILLCLLIVTGLADSSAQKSDPAALAQLRGLKEHYAAFKSMSMDFALDIDYPENDQNEVKRGTMWVQGQKFRVQLDDQTVICDNETVWLYVEEVNEVQITDFDPEAEDVMSPSELFNLPESEYLVMMGELKTEGSKKIQVLELAPLNKTLDFHKIKIFINTADKSLHKAIVFDKNGIQYIYRIEKFTSNPPLAADTFSFDPNQYENLEVIDLRD